MEAGGACLASNGITLETGTIAEVAEMEFDSVLVSSSWTPEQHMSPRLGGYLRKFYRRGAALDSGAFVLAGVGPLDGKRATVHYEHMNAFIN